MDLLRLLLKQERPAVREMIRNSPGWVIYERTRTGNWPTSRERAWVVGKRQRQFGTNKGNETGIGDIMRFRHPDGEARGTQHVRSPSMKMRGGPGFRMIDERGAYQKHAGINNPSVVFFFASRQTKAGAKRMHASDPYDIRCASIALWPRESNGIVAV